MSLKSVTQRITYTLQMMRTHRHALGEVYRQPPVPRISELSPQALQEDGVEVLVLDFDGVLASDGEPQPVAEVAQWLEECVEVFGAEKVFVLTNKPKAVRIEHFQQHYPGVQYVAGVRKKPYPDGLEQIIKLSECAPDKIAVFDDRLLTGCLAGCIVKTRIVYIRQPYVQFFRRPVQESFFCSLRVMERAIIGLST